MQITIIDPILSTWIFGIILLVFLCLYIRKSDNNTLFPISTTQELKGFAILAIIFSHIGYFLVTDHQFLFPLSVLAGVGVNLFLFVSGYGLTRSMLVKNLSIKQFYIKHLPKLYIPFWIVIVIFFFLDFFLLGKVYGFGYIIQSAIGFFPHANLYLDVDSPLWYFTFIVFYYLLFPLIFFKKRPWLTAIGIYAITFAITTAHFSKIADVNNLYSLHIIAFPLGIIVAWLLSQYSAICQKVLDKIRSIRTLSYTIGVILIAIAGYLAYFSGIGTPNEQLISVATMLAIVFLFLIKNFKLQLLYIFGIYSYELYLIHWPIMYRYDIFYAYIPAWLATALYLTIFLGIGWLIKKSLETV